MFLIVFSALPTLAQNVQQQQGDDKGVIEQIQEFFAKLQQFQAFLKSLQESYEKYSGFIYWGFFPLLFFVFVLLINWIISHIGPIGRGYILVAQNTLPLGVKLLGLARATLRNIPFIWIFLLPITWTLGLFRGILNRYSKNPLKLSFAFTYLILIIFARQFLHGYSILFFSSKIHSLVVLIVSLILGLMLPIGKGKEKIEKTPEETAEEREKVVKGQKDEELKALLAIARELIPLLHAYEVAIAEKWRDDPELKDKLGSLVEEINEQALKFINIQGRHPRQIVGSLMESIRGRYEKDEGKKSKRT